MDDQRELNVRKLHDWLNVLLEMSTKTIMLKEIDLKKPWYNLNMKRMKNKIKRADKQKRAALRKELLKMIKKAKKKYLRKHVINKSKRGVWASIETTRTGENQ